jgi:hypothetical protein
MSSKVVFIAHLKGERMNRQFLGLCLFAGVTSAHGQCSGTQMEKLIDRGFSKSEIQELCGGGRRSSGGGRKERTAEEPDDEDQISTTCRYRSGPKAGRTQYFRPDTPGLTPARVGQPCHDGQGSVGTAVPDRR